MKYKNILDHWDELIEKQEKDKYSVPRQDDNTEKQVVWVASHNTADSYEVDEEWVGITKDGQLYWAYASGCSCWEGEFNTSPIKDIKTFSFDHKEFPPEEWLKALEKFNEDLEIIRIEAGRDWDKRHA